MWYGAFTGCMGRYRSSYKINVLAKGAGKMQSLKLFNSMTVLVIAGCLSACSNTPSKSPDVADNIRNSLDQATTHLINASIPEA
jgi:hypothetical protein